MKKTAESLEKKLLKLKNACDQPLFSSEMREDFSISLLPDKKISLGMFSSSKILPTTYYAHPQTIRALRKDIFAAGDDLFIDLQCFLNCPSCARRIDIQFWFFCPYCTQSFDGLH